jgi:acetyl-CoA carboxylase biotin carboxyl carrier protein
MATMKILSELNATVWKIIVAPGNRVVEGDTLFLLESMKMEIPVTAPCDGTVTAIVVSEEQTIVEGEWLATLES